MLSRRVPPIAAWLSLLFACEEHEFEDSPAFEIILSAQIMTPGDPPQTIRPYTLGLGTPEVDWSLSGPGTLGTRHGRETTYTPPAEAAPGTTATVSASWSTYRASAVVTLSPPPVTVRGRVVDPDGRPLPGSRVLIVWPTGPWSERITDDSGTFTWESVRIPYDLTVAATDSIETTVTVYQGLLRTDPTFGPIGRAEVGSAAAGASMVSSHAAPALPGTPIFPADGATDVVWANSEPRVSWTQVAGGVTVTALAGPAGRSFVSIVSAGTAAGFPDLQRFQAPSQNGETWTWQVIGVEGLTSVDEFSFTGRPLTVSDPVWAFTFRRYQVY